jgi:hypothetical protein
VGHVDINLFARLFAQRFDFPRSPDYARCLIKAAMSKKSLESVYKNQDGLPPDSFFHFFQYSMQEVMTSVDCFFARQARIMDEHGCTVAIDTNDVEYWGVVDEYVHKKKRAMKNHYVLRYATVSIVDTRHKLTLSCMPVSKNDRMEDIVRMLLEKARSMVRVDTVLFDRGFYNATILKTARRMGMDYVIPLRKTVGTDRIWMECKKKDTYKIRYTMNRYTSPVQSWLYLSKKKEADEGREYVGVLSNKNICPEVADDFMDRYFVRCNIENGYKEKNEYKIKTCSTDKAYRLLLYCVGHYLMNLVQLVRRINNSVFRNDEMKKLLEQLLRKTLRGEHRLTRDLIVIA